MTSETHLRQMKLFSENANTILKRKSAEFEACYLEHLRLRHANTLVNANNVYQQLIRDKTHVHMNATMWATLSDFVQYLGRTGKCQVQETERGWYVKYIPRPDAVQLAKEQLLALRQEADLRAEEEYLQRMERLRKEAATDGGASHAVALLEPTEKEKEAEPIRLELATLYDPAKKVKKVKAPTKASIFSDDGEESEEEEQEMPKGVPLPLPMDIAPMKYSRKRSHPETSEPENGVSQQSSYDEKKQISKDSGRSDVGPWMYPGLIVRIIHKKSEYFRQKVIIEKVKDDSTAQAYLIDDPNIRVTVDQRHVETTIPKTPGERVLIVGGKHRGQFAIVKELDKCNYRAMLIIEDAKRVKSFDFEDFCKYRH